MENGKQTGENVIAFHAKYEARGASEKGALGTEQSTGDEVAPNSEENEKGALIFFRI